MRFSRTQAAYFGLEYNRISLFSKTFLGLQVVKIVQGLQTFNPHFTVCKKKKNMYQGMGTESSQWSM
jgi:hypothetical protein